MKKTILSIFFVILGTAVLWGCSSKKEEKAQTQTSKQSGAIVAKVGDMTITADELKQVMTSHGRFFPGKLNKKTVLKEMIREDAMVIRAKALGLNKDPDVQRRYRNILISKLREKEIGQKLTNIKLTDATLQDYYQKHIQQFTIPERVHLAEIRIAIPPHSSVSQLAELKKKMAQCREKALAQKESVQGFGKLAAEYSQDTFSRGRGGDMGWFEKGRVDHRMEPAVIKAGFALKKPGQVSNIITTDKGLYLLKLIDRRPRQVIPFTNIRDRIRQQILSEKRMALAKQFDKEVLNAVKIETYPKVLDEIKIPEQPQGSQMYRSMPERMSHPGRDFGQYPPRMRRQAMPKAQPSAMPENGKNAASPEKQE